MPGRRRYIGKIGAASIRTSAQVASEDEPIREGVLVCLQCYRSRTRTNVSRIDHAETRKRVVLVCRLLVAFTFAVAMLHATPASAQSVSNPASTASQQQTDDPGSSGVDDFARPPRNLFQMMYQYKTAPGSGSAPGTKGVVTTDTVNLRADRRIDVAPQWELALRADLPLLAKNPFSSDNPNGDYLYGVGDADVQAALIHEFDARWSAGAGLRIYGPTGGDVLGAGKWQAMPIVGARYALPEISSGSYVEPLVRYDASFAGDVSRKTISNVQFAPTFNLSLPDRWFITFYPSADIRINYGDPLTGQTGRLFLPFDARVGRKVRDNLALSLEVGVPIIKDYPVYNIKTEVRLNFTY
jgi:hypothetical protein